MARNQLYNSVLSFTQVTQSEITVLDYGKRWELLFSAAMGYQCSQTVLISSPILIKTWSTKQVYIIKMLLYVSLW